MNNRQQFNTIKSVIRLTLPTLIAYFAMSLVFGVLFAHAGYDWYLAPLMSGIVYAGAVQYVALQMMTDNAGIFAILLATFFIALRNSFYGLSVIDRFKPASLPKRFFLIFGLVDATYAIFSLTPLQEDDIRFCFYVTLFPYLSWVGGSFTGAVLAAYIPEIEGLNFILTSFFAVLVIEYYLLNRKVDALFIPILAAFVAYWLYPQYYLLTAIMSCAFYLYVKIRITSS